MKRVKIIYYIILFLLFVSTDVNALSCNSENNSKIIKASSNIKINYEVIDNSKQGKLTIGNDKTTYIIPNYIFEISIYNLTSEYIYVRVTNENNDEVFDAYNEITENGVYTFKDFNFNDYYEYKFDIISSVKPCIGEKVKTIFLKKPKYNVFSEYDYCKSNNSYFCKKFITSDLSFSDESGFFKQINVNSNNDKKKNVSLIDSIKSQKNIIFIAIGTTAVIAIIAIIILNLKTRGDKL